MWTCSQCGQKNDDQFGVCWKCATAAPAKPASKPGPKPLEQLKWICLLIAAMPGVLLLSNGGTRNAGQSAFRIGVFLLGAAGYGAIKFYQRAKMKGDQ